MRVESAMVMVFAACLCMRLDIVVVPYLRERITVTLLSTAALGTTVLRMPIQAGGCATARNPLVAPAGKTSAARDWGS